MNNNLTLLLVDGNEADRVAVRVLLKQSELSIRWVEACDAATAIVLLKNLRFDCVFLSDSLTDDGSLNLLESVRREGFAVPVIVLTTEGNDLISHEIIQSVASVCLPKILLTTSLLHQTLVSTLQIHKYKQYVEQLSQQLQENQKVLTQKNREIEQHQKQIKLQKLQLIEAVRLKSRFLAATSHELRTPMNAIIGFSQVLLRGKKGTLNMQQIRMTERILENARHLLALIDDILDFAKLESNSPEFQLERFNLSVWVLNIVEQLRPMATRKCLDLRVESSLRNPFIENDRKRIRQIVTNLVSNAIKFTSSGSIYVRLEELPENRIGIVVQDSGAGIAKADLKHIFEAFQQADQTLARRYGGAGLGLAIANALVDLMNGQLKVESVLGEGSTFRVELPRQIPIPDLVSFSTQRNMPADESALPAQIDTDSSGRDVESNCLNPRPHSQAKPYNSTCSSHPVPFGKRSNSDNSDFNRVARYNSN